MSNVKQSTDTQVVNIRQSSYDVYIGRAGKGLDGYFGNPFRLDPTAKKGSTLEEYKAYFYNRFETDPLFKKNIQALKGLHLGCFCKPNPCHGDIIKEYLDSL